MIEMPQNTTQADRISNEDLQKLIETRGPYCISIYLPTHTTGEEVLQRQDAKTLEAALRKIKKALESRSWTPEDIEKRLEPIQEFIEDGEFWRHQSEGLVLFSSASWTKAFTLPMAFQPENRISERFYLLPLVAELSIPKAFNILSLELERIRLFKGSGRGLREIDLKDAVPQRKEDRVGYDYEQKGLQFRSQHQAHDSAGFHGHAEADRDRKNEIQRFFRQVDQGLQSFLEKDPAPLVIASQDYLAALYREVNTYGNLLEGHIVVNLSEVSQAALHEEALALLTPFFNREKEEKHALLLQYLGSGKASTDLEVILKAGQEGRIDTLFLGKESGIWGTFDAPSGAMKTVSDPDMFTESLTNLAVFSTLQKGGWVYMTPEARMPDDKSVAALFRY